MSDGSSLTFISAFTYSLARTRIVFLEYHYPFAKPQRLPPVTTIWSADLDPCQSSVPNRVSYHSPWPSFPGVSAYAVPLPATPAPVCSIPHSSCEFLAHLFPSSSSMPTSLSNSSIKSVCPSNQQLFPVPKYLCSSQV